MAHLLALPANSAFVARNLIASSPASHCISSIDFVMTRFVAPVASVFSEIAVLVLEWMARLVLRAVSGVCGVFMASIINIATASVHVHILENRT